MDDDAFEHRHWTIRLRQDNLSRELPAVLLEIRLALNLDPDDIGGDGAFGTGRP